MNRKFLKRTMTRKVMATILALSLGLGMIPTQSVSLAAGSTATEEMSEDENYTRLEIRTAQDFADFVSQCYIDSWSKDKYVVLMNDIDLTEAEYETVPVFNGIFDGNGNTISGFNYTGSGYVVGLFRYVKQDGIVKDLTLKGDIESENEQECIGSIAGVNYGTIRNCAFVGNVSGRDTVGGIVGINEETGTISNCTSNGRITGYYSTGGIVGINHGAINSCINKAGVNDDAAWVETDDEMGGVEMVKNLVSDDDSEVYSGVDSGGIAGYSDGGISSCTNFGTIGYEHTGYNIGGIVGRQAGIISLCTNNGTVYGRKDVGGIAGQMEPDIEVNEAESLRDAVDKLHDLANKTIDDMSDTKNVLTNDIEIMRQFADAAIDTGDDLVTQISDFADENIGDINTLTSRLEHVMDMIPDALDYADDAVDAARRLTDVLKQLSDDLDVMGKLDDSTYDETEYNRISLLSTVGGVLTANSSNPETGAEVTITVTPDDGYKLKTGTKPVVTDSNGNKIAVTEKKAGKEYTFTMPEENVKVEAEFEYEGTFLVKSNVGGTVSKKKDGDKYTYTVKPSNGYQVKTVTIDGVSATPDSGTTDEYTVDKTQYNFNGKSKIFEVEFEKDGSKLYKARVVTSTGGWASIDGDNAAAEGDKIRIAVTRNSGYTFNASSDIKVNGSLAQVAAVNGTTNEYDVTMPSIGTDTQYTITVQFHYDTNNTNNTDTVYTESTPGGTVQATLPPGSNRYEVVITADDGYDVADNRAVVVYDVSTLGGETEKNALPKTDLDKSDSDNVNSYSFQIDKPTGTNKSRIYVNFEKTSTTGTNEYEIMTFSSTGGTIASNVDEAKQGETITLTPASSTGYVLQSIIVKSDSGTTINTTATGNGKSYSFTMPDENVNVEAQFVPIDIILTSNLSGNATYSGNSLGKVTLTVSPSTAYTLESAPSVTNSSGSSVPVSKKQGGSYVYEFSVAGNENDTYKVNITFKQQSNKQAVDTATDEIDDQIDNLSRQADNVERTVNNIRDIVTDDDGNMKSWSEISSSTELLEEITNLAEYLGEMSSSTASILRNLSVIYNVLEPYVSDAADAAKDDADKANTEVQAAIDALDAANDIIKSIVNYINDQESIKFSQLGDGFDATKQLFHDQLKALSSSLKTLNENASSYSDIINDDLRAVNDQMNVVFNLLADRLTDAEDTDLDDIYEDVTDEDIAQITNGRAEFCKNVGVVQGDINIGGIAGSMSIDDEDPEDSAAGNVEYKIGRRYIANCLIIDCVNEGYITSKKDGAGGVCGYMNHGIIVDSEGYGSVESTEGDYVGGICGQSLTIIKRCFALCAVSGGQNVGGIAGYADTLTDCYAMVDVTAQNGRAGAIAGQVVSYEQLSYGDSVDAKVYGNYYVSDEMFGIDNISYVGVAEPITYQELLEVENVPTQFWHLKVIYKIEDTILGSQEMSYGQSLDDLDYPTIPQKEGYYGMWPDVTGEVMGATKVIEAEYKDSVTVVVSTGVDGDKALALIEDNFTDDTVLIAKKVDMANSTLTPPTEIGESNYVIYQLSIEDEKVDDTSSFAVRLLNPYDDNATVYAYVDGQWTQLESKVRGQYLQVTMTGSEQYFCVVENKSNIIFIIACAVAAAVVVILLIVIIKTMVSKINRKKHKKQQSEAQEK